MIHLQPGERAWVDQQDARLRDALNVVLDRITDIDFHAPDHHVRTAVENVGHAIGLYIAALDDDDIRLLACTAVIRLAERIHNTQEHP